MATGHSHAEHTGQEEMHRLMCEMFDPGTTAQRREEIRAAVSGCPECAAHVRSEQAVRELVRDCCGQARAPEPLRDRIIASITTISYTEVRFHQ